MSIQQNIYVVEAHDGNNVDQITRAVIIAVNAAEAEVKAAAIIWPGADMTKRAELIEQGRVTAGRLGTYEPGITGANMSRGACIAVQRIGQR
jgi:hypothetical protein